MIPPPPRSTLFPYTTLFRSQTEEILTEAQQRSQESHPAGGLLPGAFELVVEHGVFKGLQVQRGGVLHHSDADAVGEPVPQQAVEQGVGSSQDVAGDGQAELQRDQLPDARTSAPSSWTRADRPGDV